LTKFILSSLCAYGYTKGVQNLFRSDIMSIEEEIYIIALLSLTIITIQRILLHFYHVRLWIF